MRRGRARGRARASWSRGGWRGRGRSGWRGRYPAPYPHPPRGGGSLIRDVHADAATGPQYFMRDAAGRSMRRVESVPAADASAAPVAPPSAPFPVPIAAPAVKPLPFGTVAHGGIVKAHVYADASKKRAIKKFDKRTVQTCQFWSRLGHCKKNETGECMFMHDARHIGVCRKWVRGECKLAASACALQHAVDADKMPVCERFRMGICPSSERCEYLHVHVGSDAPVCNDFASKGYCSAGARCRLLHTWDCAQYRRNGTCADMGTCRLQHLDEAGCVRAQRWPLVAGEERRAESTAGEAGVEEAGVEEAGVEAKSAERADDDGFLSLAVSSGESGASRWSSPGSSSPASLSLGR